MNVLCISGNIVRSIEAKKSNDGKDIANFTVAINEGKDKTEFVNCVAFGKTAELISQYCNKGDRLSCNGKISTSKWQDKEGKNRYKTEMIVNQFDFPPKVNSEKPSFTKDVNEPLSDNMSDEIPF